MKKILVLMHQPNPKQISALKKIAEFADNTIFYIMQNSSHDNTNNLKFLIHINAEEYIKMCSEADELLIVATDDWVPPEAVINKFFSYIIKEIRVIRQDGILSNLSAPTGQDRVLLIFPGSVFPINLGSHQRVFNVIYNLRKNNIFVDLLATLPKNADVEKYRLALRGFCSNVYFYKNKTKKYTKLTLLKRVFDEYILKLLSKKSALPDLFSERCFSKPTESCKRWVNSLYLLNRYKNIIVSYAWMLPSIEYIKVDIDSFKLFCDTHDVQFVRNTYIADKKQRFVYSEKQEKKLEIKLLNSCDIVMAISESDKEYFKAELNNKVRIIKSSPGFEYALAPIRQRPPGKPINFGFIGGKMFANVDSLHFILDNWWPVIKKYSPDSRLYIAGSVSNDPTLLPKIFYDEMIIKMGFVKNIDDFYKNIDVALNPVTIQGGLNFKSVEAVLAGKHLFTNRLGQACLGDGFISFIVDTEDDILLFFKTFEFNLQEDKKQRLFAQSKAKKFFSNKIMKNSLINHLFF
ncbi:MAG: glycosyltransferase [Campylobacteraceae bacterium]|jgi:hypothetical protein|nr:glycosyltransferase [Campylobacteraceae bacterium]